MSDQPHSATLADESSTSQVTETAIVGTIPATRLIPLALLALFAGLGAVALVAGAGDVQLTGFLRAEQSAIYAPRDGRIESLVVHGGDIVKPRQLLLKMTDETLDREIASKAREVKSLEATLEQCRAKADVQLSLQLKDLDDNLHRTRLQSAEYLHQHFAASFEQATWKNFTKEVQAGRWLAVGPDVLNDPDRFFSSLVTEPVVTPEVVRLRAVMRQEEARSSAELKKAQADLCDHHITELQSTKKNLPDQIRKAAGVDVAEARLAQASEQFESLSQQKTEMAISTTGHGIIGTVNKQVADPVSAGEVLMTVFDHDRLFVDVDVPSKLLGKLSVGQSLRVDFAEEDFSGRIVAIAPQAQHIEGSQDSTVRVRINPAGRQWTIIPIGSAVSVRLK